MRLLTSIRELMRLSIKKGAIKAPDYMMLPLQEYLAV